MPFDLQQHKEKQKIINYARAKWPQEKNISKLLKMASNTLRLEIKQISSATATHLPSPEESAKQDPGNKFSFPCPQCNKKTFILRSLCKGCKDSEGGRFKTILKCYECGYNERSEKPIVLWLQEIGIDFNMTPKKNLGVETITDEGIK